MARSTATDCAEQKRLNDLVKLRGIGMRLAGHLQTMMPPEPPRRTKKSKDGEASKKKAEEAEAATPLPPEFGRLLGRNDGVIDSFNKLVQLVIRILDKEKETRDPTQTSSLAFDEHDEEELDRRIEDELDRIAARRRAAGGTAADTV
jgi:hypothetical protein